MHSATITDDHELAQRNTTLTHGVLAMLPLITTDPSEQASALLTAAAVIIERDVGAAMAPATLSALIEPTIAAWTAPPAGTVRQ